MYIEKMTVVASITLWDDEVLPTRIWWVCCEDNVYRTLFAMVAVEQERFSLFLGWPCGKTRIHVEKSWRCDELWLRSSKSVLVHCSAETLKSHYNYQIEAFNVDEIVLIPITMSIDIYFFLKNMSIDIWICEITYINEMTSNSILACLILIAG